MKRVLVLFSAMLLVLAGHAFGQVGNASIGGEVTDGQGRALTSATVSATNNATKQKSVVTTNGSGYYSITNLPIGAYTVDVEATGFEKYIRHGITLTTSQVMELDVQMHIGSVNQSIEVTGGGSLVETRTSDVTQLIESKTISDLPLANRRTMNVIATMGASVFLSDSPAGQPVYSLAGGRIQSQMTYLDGALSQNSRLGAGQQSIDPPVDTIQEIEVMQANYPAQYGNNAGGVVIETTKSGTNMLHGSAYEFLRNDAVDAAGYFAPVQPDGQKVKPELRYSVFGETLGGAIKHSKTFFFAGYEGGRQHSGSTTVLTVPTVAERAGNFSALLTSTPVTTTRVNACDGSTIYSGQIFDPSTTRAVGPNSYCRTAFPGNIIPAAGADAVGLNVLGYYPLPNTAGTSAGANNFSGNELGILVSDFVDARIDHTLTSKDHLTGRYMFYRANSTFNSVYPDPAADPTDVLYAHTNQYYGSWTRVVSNNKVNNFDFAFYQRVANQFSVSYGGNYPQKLGLTGVPQDAFPQFNVSGFAGLGSSEQVWLTTPIRQEQYLDNFSWELGRHDLKFGGEVRPTSFTSLNNPTASGSFTFPSQPTAYPDATVPNVTLTGNGLASLYVGFPTALSLLDDDKIDRKTTYVALYLQDDWTASSRLTLNLGLRWEMDTPMYDAHNVLNGFNATQINPVSGTPGVVKFAGVNGYPRDGWVRDLNNFAPRLGFAFKPFDTDTTVIRGGYGVYFGPPLDNTTQSQAALGFTVQASLNSPNNGITAPFYLRNGVPVTPTPPALTDSYGAVPAPYTNANTAVSYYDRNRKNEYNHQFNLTVEHQLSSSIVVQASGIGNLGRKLSSTNQNIDQIAPSVLSPTTDTQAYRPYPQFSQVTIVSPTNGTMNYYALELRVEKRFSGGLNLVSTYTQAKNLGNTNDSANSGAGSYGAENGTYSNLYNRLADYGPEENDIEKRFTFNTVYELPFGPGRRWVSNRVLGAIVGGWSIGNLTTVQSGGAMTAITNTNNTNAFSSGSQRPNLVGNPNLSRGKRSVQEWFATNQFSQPAPFTFGNEGQGVIRAPGHVDLDFSVLRSFKLVGRSNLQLRADAFNALNHSNFAPPGTVFGAPNFGVISALSGNSNPRILDVVARIEF